MKKTLIVAAAAALASAAIGETRQHGPMQPRAHENTEWSTAYAYHLADAKGKLPRVLLVGDSIVAGYQGEVRRMLEGRMNVSYWASSYCVTSPSYMKLLEVQLDEAKYAVIHFNNGLHSLGTPTDEWAKGFEAALKLIRRKQPDAKIVWATSTPLKDSAKTAKSRELNAAGANVVAKLGDIETNDLFALLDPLDREKNWSDVYHHRPHVRRMAAGQVVRSVLSANAAPCKCHVAWNLALHSLLERSLVLEASA